MVRDLSDRSETSIYRVTYIEKLQYIELVYKHKIQKVQIHIFKPKQRVGEINAIVDKNLNILRKYL